MKQKIKADKQIFSKAPTGISGLDEITSGGLPEGRITLVVGAAGTGKTVLAMETLVRAAAQYNEPGVFITLEETREELSTDFNSFSFYTDELINRGKIFIDHISIEPGELVEIGEYELDGLLLRVENLINSVGARRVVLDGIPALFYGFSSSSSIRRSLGKLMRWLKDKEMTTIVTAESGTELIQQGLGRTLSDCIIELSKEVHERISTRYIKIAKYRGSRHASDQFPFMIGEGGISVLPVTSIELDYEVSSESVPSGIDGLDIMLGGGYYRGSSILISGEAGTGKSSIAATLAASICNQGQRCIFLSLEESRSQVFRNMKSAGIDLAPYKENGMLMFQPMRPTQYGLEMQLIAIKDLVREHEPAAVIIDPVSNLEMMGTFHQVKSMVARLIDLLKSSGITTLFTALVDGNDVRGSGVGASSLMDTWINLRNLEVYGEQTRLLNIVKSRGMAHSNKVREFLITSKGVALEDVYFGPAGILTGNARAMQQIRDKMETEERRRDIDYKKEQFEQKKKEIEVQIASLQSDLKQEEREFRRSIRQMEAEVQIREKQRQQMGSVKREGKVSSDGNV